MSFHCFFLEKVLYFMQIMLFFTVQNLYEKERTQKVVRVQKGRCIVGFFKTVLFFLLMHAKVEQYYDLLSL